MSLYPYVNFRNAGTSVHKVDCNNTDVRYNGCPYLEFLERQDYTDYLVIHIGRITTVYLKNYSAHEKKFLIRKTFAHYAPGTAADKQMKRLLIILVCVFVCGPAVAHSVTYNRNSHIYHSPSCEWAQKCTKNCITIDSVDAKRRGGRPCKVCGG